MAASEIVTYAAARQTTPHVSLEKDAPEPRPIQLPERKEWLQCPLLVDCTTATNDALPKRIGADITRHRTRPAQTQGDVGAASAHI